MTKVITPKGKKVCFFTGDPDGSWNDKLVRFHIIGRGGNSSYKENPDNIVWAKHKFNMMWEKNWNEKIKIPNVLKAYKIMKDLDEQFFFQQLGKMEQFLNKEKYNKVLTFFNLDENWNQIK